MPATHFSSPPQRRPMVPDYPAAIAMLDRLAYQASDPRLTTAIAVVRRGRTPSSVECFARNTIRILTWFNQRGIDVLHASIDDCQEWWNCLAGYAPLTRNAYLQCLRLFYEEALEREFVRIDPSRKIEYEGREPLTETPALTRDQARLLLRVLAEEANDSERWAIARRDAAMIRFMLRLCLRESETQNLVWGNVGMTNGVTVVSFVGKGRKPAQLTLPGDVLTSLAAWRAVLEEMIGRPVGPADAIFSGLSTRALKRARSPRRTPIKPLARSEIFWVVRNRLAQIGVVGPRMGPHALRATGATLAYERGADLIACQGLLRHSSIETTRRFYIKRTEDKANEAIDRMGLSDLDSDE